MPSANYFVDITDVNPFPSLGICKGHGVCTDRVMPSALPTSLLIVQCCDFKPGVDLKGQEAFQHHRLLSGPTEVSIMFAGYYMRPFYIMRDKSSFIFCELTWYERLMEPMTRDRKL